MQLFNDQSEAKFAYLHSMDDKAYVRPGTSEGFKKTRNVRILTACDSARQLPKYDWPEALMYQTPAAHRIMEKEVLSVDNKPTLAKTSDRHFVIVRPKAYVDSSGSTWASEVVKLRAIEADVFEVPGSGENVAPKVRTYVLLIHISVFQYYDMTEQEDFKKNKT